MASAKSLQATLSIDMIEDNPYPGSRRADAQRSLCVGSARATSTRQGLCSVLPYSQ